MISSRTQNNQCLYPRGILEMMDELLTRRGYDSSPGSYKSDTGHE